MRMGMRRVRCSTKFLHDMLTGKICEAASDFPQNAEIVDVRICDDDRLEYGTFSIIVQSEMWEPLIEGQSIPILLVTLSIGDKAAA